MKSATRKSGASERFVADFETTTDPLDCRVWLWSVASVELEDVVDWGIDILSFVRFCAQRNSVMHFHNLKFDGMFILDWLLNNGYSWVPNRPKHQEFTTLISGQGQFYSIRVTWGNGCVTEFRDSLKKLPMTVERIARAFKLPESKGKLDYDAPRPVGYNPTDAELEYVFNDVIIVARALNVQHNEGLTSLTVGADALKEFKEIVSKNLFRHIFPVLPDHIDADMRRAYRGGFTYVDPRSKGRRVGRGRVYDVNSLYPSVMYDRVLPYGEPVYWTGPPEVDAVYPLYITTVTITAKLRKNHIPCIPIKAGMFGMSTLYAESVDEPKQFSVTNVDWNLWNDHYDIDVISYDGTWRFHGISGVFSEYIDKWSQVKATSKGGRRELAKLMLNSLYGKFATNPDVTGKYPQLDSDNKWSRPVVRLSKGPEERREPVYTPMGVFITAYARDVTIRAAQAHYDTFAYCDTDSLHLLVGEDPKDLDIDPTRLGAWKHEMTFDDALFMQAKRYTERTVNEETLTELRWAYDPDHDGDHHTHIAGLPRGVQDKLRFSDFYEGATFRGKLSPCRVPGGVVLEEVSFTLTNRGE